MLLLQNNVKALTQSKGWVRNLSRNLNNNNYGVSRLLLSVQSQHPLTSRSYTSSFSNGKGHDSSNNQNRSATTTEDEEKINKDKQQEPFVGKQPPSSTLESSFSFMPVINIPQTEFAHNAFFSLHRPLLGLADEEEKPFFSNHPPEDDDVDEELASYMMHLRPFESPVPPGTKPDQDNNIKQDKDYTTVTFSTGDSMLPEEEFYMEQTLPMFYMPDSDEIVEYLATMQEQLVRKNALDDNKKDDDVDNDTTMGRSRKRLAAAAKTSTSTGLYVSSKHQKRHQQGLYRHRWNK